MNNLSCADTKDTQLTANSCQQYRTESTKSAMPINSDMPALYPEMLSKTIASVPGATSSATPSSSLPSKSNVPAEQQATLSSSNAKLVENSLIKHQGQKWQQYFDFEKMLKQIRIAEKQHLRNKGDSATGSSNNGKNSSPANASSAVSPSKAVNTASFKCARPLKQVQRLNGNDMHYYGIVPKQTAVDVIVCSVCRGIYTKVGFNNHMMLQHPTVWSTISAKISASSSVNDAYSLLTNDNSQDCVRDAIPAVAAEIVGSPSDLSGIMSTSSNASSSSSSMSSSAHATTPRHKGSKGGSTAGSSSSSNGGRSRSKQTKHSSSTATTTIHSSSASSDAGHTASKGSKKSTTANTANSTAATATTPTTLNTNSTDSVQAITIFSSSSNSSCSLPPTPKLVGANAIDTVGPPAPQESTFSPASLLPRNDTKEKTATVDSAASFVVSSKKKVKSPTFTAHESVDSSTSNSSSEYDHASSSGTGTGTGTSSKSSLAPFVSGPKESVVGPPVPMKATGGRDLNCFDAQISELDQAVSSITGGQENNKNGACMEGIAVASSSVCPAATTFQMPPSTTTETDKLQTIVAPIAAVPPLIAQNYVVPEMSQVNDEPMQHNTSDDNSILTLEDVLDSKFINEILNTAESEIHFDESELDTAAQQTYQQHQPVAKRMRYDESLIEQSHQQSVPSEMSGDFTAYQQQTQQQYAHYDASTNLEDIKVYGAPQQSSMAAQYQTQFGKTLQEEQQHQITTIDAMQLQQLLYQQQNLNVYGGVMDPSTASAMQQQQQFDQSGVVSAKHIIDLCSTEDLQKSKGMGLGAGEFSAMEPTIHNTYEDGAYNTVAAHFQLYNVPSLTDDMTNEVDMLVPHIVGSVPRTEPQYVLPSNEEHLIYEITDNNQVAVMSQQRQQQVIAEFLTQATYESMEHMNAANSVHSENLAAITNPTASALTAPGNCKENWDEVSDLLDFDFSCIETVKSLTGSSSAAAESKSVKTEHSKYYDDFYFNVFIYAGIPRPLSINCFGLVKLPLAAATTFRKHLLSTRKANNSPISLGGGINGIVGNNAATAAARLANVNSKSIPNYFSSLPSGSSGSGAAIGNEFSIGSITITNSPMTQHQAYTHSKQSATGNGGNGSMEITFNATANGSAMSPVSALHRSRSKANNVNASSAGSAVKNKPQGGGSTPVAVVTPTSRLNSRSNTNLLSQNAKTIYVCSTPSNINDRVKFIKRGALLSCKAEVSRKHKFSSRQIADILGGGSVGKGASLRHQSPLQQNATSESSHEALADEQIRLNRVNRFYERRRKLFDLACNPRQYSEQQQQPQQQRQRLPKQQLCGRMFTDYGVGGLSHCKSSNPGSTGAGDAVSVFV